MRLSGRIWLDRGGWEANNSSKGGSARERERQGGNKRSGRHTLISLSLSPPPPRHAGASAHIVGVAILTVTACVNDLDLTSTACHSYKIAAAAISSSVRKHSTHLYLRSAFLMAALHILCLHSAH